MKKLVSLMVVVAFVFTAALVMAQAQTQPAAPKAPETKVEKPATTPQTPVKVEKPAVTAKAPEQTATKVETAAKTEATKTLTTPEEICKKQNVTGTALTDCVKKETEKAKVSK